MMQLQDALLMYCDTEYRLMY